MSWLNKTKEEEAADEVERQKSLQVVPKEVTDKLGKIDGLETKLNEFGEKTKVLDRMTTFLDEQDSLKTAARAREATERAKKVTEETEDLWMTDPKKATEEAMLPLKIAQINTSSIQLRNELFSDGINYEFYQGDFKKRVDHWIDKLPVAARVDPESLKNCYNIVLGENHKEIREGKIKSRFAATTTTGTNSSTSKGGDGLPTLTKEQEDAADRFGMTREDYAKEIKELNYV